MVRKPTTFEVSAALFSAFARGTIAVFLLAALLSCGHSMPSNTVTMLIESSPNNLDARIGTDGQSERICELIFDTLVQRDEHFNLRPFLAESWETPNPTTYIFHLHHGVFFHNGQELTSRDVQWTFDSLRNGSLITSKTSTYAALDHIDSPDPYTVIFHLKQPDATLLWNLADGAIGIVPYGSGRDFGLHPVGSGPFELVSMRQDENVILRRNSKYWQSPPSVENVVFKVVPDTTTRALELRKGSADVAINALPADMVLSLRKDSHLKIEQADGTIFAYLGLNLRDPILKDIQVRQAIAFAVNREPIIRFLWRDTVRPAPSILPPQSWAFTSDVETHPYDPEHAAQLLEAAGYHVQSDGYRLHLTMKTSSEETSRLLASILQQQLRAAGIRLEIRSYESATFYADIVRGAFQIFTLRWIGGNEDPDIFEAVFASSSFPPHRSNRGYYSNPEVDRLIAEGRAETDQQKRRAIYIRIQQIVAHDLPYINLWYFDNVLVHGPRIKDVPLNPSGNYDFLKTVELNR